MTGSTEVTLTTWRSARWEKGIVAVSLACTIVGAAVAIATDPQWWVILIWGVVGLIMLLLFVGVWDSANESARATDKLRGSGVVTRADVVAGERVIDGDDVHYLLTLEICPVGHEPFTVTHSCGSFRCQEAANNVPTTTTALVDASTRSWAVIHG